MFMTAGLTSEMRKDQHIGCRLTLGPGWVTSTCSLDTSALLSVTRDDIINSWTSGLGEFIFVSHVEAKQEHMYAYLRRWVYDSLCE